MTGRQFYLLSAAMIFFTWLTLYAANILGPSPVLFVMVLCPPLAALFLIIWTNSRPERVPESPTVTLVDICRTAMYRVNVKDSAYTLTDIGLLAYTSSDDSAPLLIRTTTIPKNIRYLQPFAEVEHSLISSHEPVTLAVEICEERSAVLFHYEMETRWDGDHPALVLPPTWLDVSITEKDLSDKNWSIRVRVDGKLLALHMVYWSKFDETDIEKETRRDGEISPKLRRLIEQERDSTNISLDDLLIDQRHHDK